MVNTMQEEVEHEEEGSIREQSVDVKQESVEYVFENGPEYVPGEEARDRGGCCAASVYSRGGLTKVGFVHHSESDGKPDEGDYPPGGESEHLEVGLREEFGRVGEMSRLMDLLQVERL